MNSKTENAKTKKKSAEESKSTPAKIKIVPLEKLKSPKNNTPSTPTRQSNRSNAGNKLNLILSATHKPKKDKPESVKTPETKIKKPENNAEESEKMQERTIKKEPCEVIPPIEHIKSIMKLESLRENFENYSNENTPVKKRKRIAAAESSNSHENESKRKKNVEKIVKKKSVTFANETTEILNKTYHRREEPTVNSATTPCKTNISPKTKRKKKSTKQLEDEDTPCEQMYVNDMLELNLDENGDGQQLTSQTDTDEDFVLNEIKPLKKVKKKGRKSKIDSDNDILSFDEETAQEPSNISLDINFEMEIDTENKKKRGRKPGPLHKVDTGTPPLYYKMKDRPGRGVRCIKCNTLVPEAFWLRHNCQMHNNLAWREGETPVDLSSKEQVFRLWNQVVKSQLPLKCGRCGDKKLSAVGFYSHVKLCGKNLNEIESQRTDCKLCGARMLAVSLKSHMVVVHSKNKEREDTNHIHANNIIDNAIKRQAANKALSNLKNLENETDNITDMYTNNNRGTKTPKYYINVWKKQISNENDMAKCFSPICDFRTKILDDILKHYDECKFAPQKVFTCKQCNYESAKEEEIVLHVKTGHEKIHRVIKKEKDQEFNVEDHADGDEQINDEMIAHDLEMLRVNERYINSPKIQKQCYKFDFLLQSKEATLPMYSFSGVILWTRQFRESHYSNLLFNEYLKTKWLPVEKHQIEKYLPDVKKSIHTSQILMGKQSLDIRTYEHQWKEYNLFEANVTSNIITIFCGGPVCSLAWVPILSSLEKEQYLAVFCKPNTKDSYRVGHSYSGPGLIQIWNCGVLSNRSKCETTPHLALGIAHDYGIIWHMEWCPSGCYQENERLGLLALATSTGHVYIISVPFSNQLSTTSTVYKTKPIYQLNLQEKASKLLGDTDMQVTKLKWSKQSGHDILIAGYSNGMVAMWNLKSTSPLLYEVKDECIHLLPYVCFQAHASAVTVVDLPNSNDIRWLLTASHDQLTKFWDLNDIRYSIVDYKRGIVTDGFWCPHWNCAIVCFDDVLMQSLTVTNLISSRDFGYKPVPLLRNNSPCKCLAVNEWMNGIAQGSVAGEWQLTFPTQMFYGLENEKNLRHRRSLGGYTEYIDRTKTPEELIKYDEKRKRLAKTDLQEFSKLSDEDVEVLPFLYEDVAEKYGVIFCDFDLSSKETIPKQAFERIHTPELLKDFPYDMYPIISLNKLAWNPNEHSYRYIAIGYEAGFVRLQCVQFMRSKID